MVVPVKHGIDVFESASLDILVVVTVLKQFFGILYHLDWGRAQLAWMHCYIGGVKTVGGTNLLEVQWLSLAAFRVDACRRRPWFCWVWD